MRVLGLAAEKYREIVSCGLQYGENVYRARNKRGGFEAMMDDINY